MRTKNQERRTGHQERRPGDQEPRPENQARRAAGFAAVLMVVATSVAVAQPPNFSGTWRLDSAQSRVTDAAGLAGIAPAGAPATLHITQPANGTLVVESEINEGHARIYSPGAKTATPVGQGGVITMASQWAERALVSEGTAVGASGSSVSVREVFSLSADGRTLTVDVTTKGTEEKTSSLKYLRIQDVGPCESWPTPCKRAA